MAEVPCGVLFFLRYRYGVEHGLPDRLNHAMLLWSGIAVMDIVVNVLALSRSRGAKRFVRLFDMLGCMAVGLGGYFLFPFFGQTI